MCVLSFYVFFLCSHVVGLDGGARHRHGRSLDDSPDHPTDRSFAYVVVLWPGYPLVTQHSYGKPACFMGKPTINGGFP